MEKSGTARREVPGVSDDCPHRSSRIAREGLPGSSPGGHRGNAAMLRLLPLPGEAAVGVLRDRGGCVFQQLAGAAQFA